MESARQADLFQAFFPEMSPEERKVWSALQNHRGRQDAITGDDLALATGLTWRKGRDIMKTLVEVYRKRIGGVPGSPPGYFLIESPEELEDVCRRYRGQALSLLRREAILRRMSLEELCGQLTMKARSREGRTCK
ncbi:MAG: hypothetical protein KKH61_20650 [Gammaproteobacteria bacterium]|nr:hypothetical protein [Gammaproteobacteria bacterium]